VTQNIVSLRGIRETHYEPFETDGLLTVKQVAEILATNENNIRQLQFRKSICWTVKFGREVYYDPADIKEYQERKAKRGKTKREPNNL
jgi:hypothetical protein